jgi:hypothetical protein
MDLNTSATHSFSRRPEELKAYTALSTRSVPAMYTFSFVAASRYAFPMSACNPLFQTTKLSQEYNQPYSTLGNNCGVYDFGVW